MATVDNFILINSELEHLKTGGGKNEALALSDAEQKVKNMIQLSIEGMPSQFDGDCEVDAMPPVHDDPNEVDGKIIDKYYFYYKYYLLL